MLSNYPACFFQEENGYSVVFPDLNYLATCGDTLDEAFAMAIDCLAGYLYLAQLNNEVVPAPSTFNSFNLVSIAEELEISSDGAFVNMISVDVNEYAMLHFTESVKKTLSIPAWLNERALDLNINFSKVLQDALIELVQRQKA